MKLLMPVCCSYQKVSTYSPGEWGTGRPLRTVYMPILYGQSNYTVDSPATFIQGGDHRWGPKPLYHKKPMGQSNVPILSANGYTLVPFWDADSHNYSSWYATIGCTVRGKWNHSGTGTSHTITASFILACTQWQDGVARRCNKTFSITVRYPGVVTVSGPDWPATKLFVSGIANDALASGFPTPSEFSKVVQPQLYRKFKSYAIGIVDAVAHDQYTSPGKFSWSKVSRTYVPSVASLTPPPDLLHEDDRARGYLVVHPSGWYHEYAKQHAFLAACEALPTLSDNMISNILELGSFIYELVENKRIEVPKSLSSAWLAYRYQYMTTKLDVAEAISFVRRHADELLRGPGLKSYGSHTYDYDGCSVTCTCTICVTSRELSAMKRVWDALSKYGLAPDFYAIWDMVPYSFIADWFLPVGAMLDVLDAARLYNSEHYDFHSIVYSVKYVQETSDGLLWSVYRRWVEATPPELEGLYWWEPQLPSKKVGVMRALDSIALIRG